ncbi:MAG TPA: ATP-binding protein [Terriglobia bacterium]|nr:ATP-binding protein [Terriglobia bacterium]
MDAKVLTDEDLRLKLAATEDAFVERKLFSDSGDWLKTAVAFANSVPVGYPAVLFIGVKDDGTPEDKAENIESVMKSFDRKVSRAYPRVYYLAKALNVCGKEVLAIMIPGSTDRPHFAGPSYVRVGSESRVASEKEFQRLIASRNSKTSEILNWSGKIVSVNHMSSESELNVYGSVRSTERLSVVDCNQFYVTLENKTSNYCKSIPLERIEVSYDQRNDCLELEVRLV